jgi:hypothetical protein
VFTTCHTKALVDDKVYGEVDEFATNTVFATFEPLSSTERLSTVSSPFMVDIIIHNFIFWVPSSPS